MLCIISSNFLVKNKKAIGIQSNDIEQYEDIVISNADIVPTFRNLLPEQKQPEKILQQDLADILQGAARKGGLKGVIISVSKVSVTTDLSIAKVHLSVFPSAKGEEILAGIKTNTPLIKHEVSQRTKHQLRRTPNFMFFIDDSLEYIDQIEKSLKGKENPIKDPTILDKRKKS